MLDAGKRRHRITFQRFNGTLDEYSDPQTQEGANWEDYATVWASIQPIRGREFYEAQQSQSEVTHKVDIRYLLGLRNDMRIKFGERVFFIASIIDWDERHESMLLMCKELVK